LVAAFNYLKEKYTDEKGRLILNPEQTKKLYNETIFGWDMEPLMVKFSLANLYLHGLKVPNVSENDTLLNENLWQHTFDIIVANPPFITPKGGARRHSRFAITSNKTEVLFCEYMVHHLNFNGRMGIIVPEGIIFDASKGHQAIRKLFLDNGFMVCGFTSSKVFNPYSPVKTSIVFLDKTLKPDQILFYEIENHGFTLNTNPAPIDKNDLPNALEVIKKYREDLQNGKQPNIDDEKFYTIASKKIIESNTTNLTGGVHREKKIKSNGAIPMIEWGKFVKYTSRRQSPQKKIKNQENTKFMVQTVL
jgi:type I restriction enzyme M protein